MHAHHDQVTEAEVDAARARPVAAEPVPDGQPHDQEPGHAEQQEQPLGGPVRGAGVGQPGVAAVHPPQHPEHQQHLDDRGGREGVAVQQRGQLGEGEREDQVEEQFQGADPQRGVGPGNLVPGRRAGAGRGWFAGHGLAWARHPAACPAMSVRYQPPRISICPGGLVCHRAGRGHIGASADHVRAPGRRPTRGDPRHRSGCPRAARTRPGPARPRPVPRSCRPGLAVPGTPRPRSPR